MTHDGGRCSICRRYLRNWLPDVQGSSCTLDKSEAPQPGRGRIFGELFCGIGGWRWAARALGYENGYAGDIDPNAVDYHVANHGEGAVVQDHSDAPGTAAAKNPIGISMA